MTQRNIKALKAATDAITGGPVVYDYTDDGDVVPYTKACYLYAGKKYTVAHVDGDAYLTGDYVPMTGSYTIDLCGGPYHLAIDCNADKRTIQVVDGPGIKNVVGTVKDVLRDHAWSKTPLDYDFAFDSVAVTMAGKTGFNAVIDAICDNVPHIVNVPQPVKIYTVNAYDKAQHDAVISCLAANDALFKSVDYDADDDSYVFTFDNPADASFAQVAVDDTQAIQAQDADAALAIATRFFVNYLNTDVGAKIANAMDADTSVDIQDGLLAAQLLLKSINTQNT